MGRVNSYTNVARPAKNDEILIDGSAGTRNVTMANLAIELAGMISADQHRSIWRGKNLGSALTDAQKAAISSGNFDDLYIGDYWSINGANYRIVDMNYWYGQGDVSCSKHHLVIMPDRQLYTHVMNDTNTTEGGYVGSKMYLEGLEKAKTTINTAFGEANILNHREYLINAVSDGRPSAGAWFDSTIELPNEVMMYGTHILAVANTGNPFADKRTVEKTQLAAMRLRPLTINPVRNSIWLRDIVSAADFAGVSASGCALYAGASNVRGVQPVFGITGGN